MDKDIIRSESDLKELANLLKSSWSFDYTRTTDAKKTIKSGIYIYTFDIPTLLPYNSNINFKEERTLDDLMLPFYQAMYKQNRETYKELCERRVLLRFLLCAPEQYKNYTIEKHIRPDFILSGDKRIGVEITELTTPFDRELFSIATQVHEKDLKTKEEIEQHIHRYHKKIAQKVKHVVCDGVPLISTDGIDIESNRIRFAEEIKTKFDKYRDTLQQYDEFIILGDAASGSGLEISEQREVDEMINYVLSICPDIIKVTTVIAWREAERQDIIIHSWYP